jgi:protein TonB
MTPARGLKAFVTHLLQGALALAAGGALTAAFFLLLPLLQEMGKPPESTLEVRQVESVALQPPPPPTPEEEKPEEKADEPPPTELSEQAAPPMDLAQLELALDPGFGEGVGGAGVLAGGRLPQAAGGSAAERDKEAESVFSLADLDQAPRPVNQAPPQYPAGLKARKLRGTVHVLFVVDRNGKVVGPRVQKATHEAFEKPALEAVRRWRFEPGKRNGQSVQFRMRVPISFECG